MAADLDLCSGGYFRRWGLIGDILGGWGFHPSPLPSTRSFASPIRPRHFSNQKAGLLSTFVFNSYPATWATPWR